MNKNEPIFAFVLMPFSNEFTDVYKLGIKETANNLDIRAERVDEQIYKEGILDRIYNQIEISDIIIADMTGRNSNVFYEVGYAHAKNKLCILLTKETSDIPFDLQHHRHIVYGNSIATLKEKLTENLIWAKTEVENYRRSRIRISTKSITGILEKSKYFAKGILDFRIDLFNDSDDISEEIEALYFYSGNEWKVSQNNVNCEKGDSDLEPYRFLYLLTPPRNKIGKKSWLPLIFKTERNIDDAFNGNKLKESYVVAGIANIRIVTSSGKYDHNIQISLQISDDLPF